MGGAFVGAVHRSGSIHSSAGLQRNQAASSFLTAAASYSTGSDVAEGGMAPAAVVEGLDVLEDRGPGLAAGDVVGAVNELRFEGREEALGDSAVPAVALSRYESIDQPTTRREYRSRIAARYRHSPRAPRES